MRLVFRLTGDDLRPDEITKMLQVTPTKAWCKGDVRMATHNGTFFYTFGCWLLQAHAPKQEPFEQQLDRLLNQLEALPDALYELTKTFDAEIGVGYTSSESTFGFYLDHRALERLYRLGVAIDFDVYTVDATEKPAITPTQDDFVQ